MLERKVFIFLNADSGVIKGVPSLHYCPDTLSDEIKARGFEVNESDIPLPDKITGKDSFLKYNTETKEFFYEYVDRPLTQDEELNQIKADYGTLLMESATDKAKIASLEATTGDLIMEVASLKMGGIA